MADQRQDDNDIWWSFSTYNCPVPSENLWSFALKAAVGSNRHCCGYSAEVCNEKNKISQTIYI